MQSALILLAAPGETQNAALEGLNSIRCLYYLYQENLGRGSCQTYASIRAAVRNQDLSIHQYLGYFAQKMRGYVYALCDELDRHILAIGAHRTRGDVESRPNRIHTCLGQQHISYPN